MSELEGQSMFDLWYYKARVKRRFDPHFSTD